MTATTSIPEDDDTSNKSNTDKNESDDWIEVNGLKLKNRHKQQLETPNVDVGEMVIEASVSQLLKYLPNSHGIEVYQCILNSTFINQLEISNKDRIAVISWGGPGGDNHQTHFLVNIITVFNL